MIFLASLTHWAAWRQTKAKIYILMWNVLIPLFPFVRRERDTEEEASVLIDTAHRHLSVFTSFQGFDGERIAVKGLIAHAITLKVVRKQKTACLTNQIVCKNKQRPKFKLVSLSFGHLAVCVCVCVLLEPAVSSALWQRGREEGPGGGWGQQQSASPPVSTAFDLMWCEKRAAPNIFHQPGGQNEPADRTLSLHGSNHKMRKGQDPAELKRGFFSTSFLNCSLEDSL